MKIKMGLIFVLIFLVTILMFQLVEHPKDPQQILSETVKAQSKHWFLLERKSNLEFLYFGEPGQKDQSQLIKKFQVKSGTPGERPTPLPQLLGREYWIVVNKIDAHEFPETAPYFLTLDVPVSDEEPFGPKPYEECNGQCNWAIPGAFGLHGVASDSSRLSAQNLGSSGCIRHSDEDITYIFNLLDPQTEEIRYYIEDI